jgi:predicted transcriptional regulator
LKSGSRRRKITIVRSQLAKELVEEWGLSLTETSRHLGVSPSAIAKALYRLDKHKSSESRMSLMFINQTAERIVSELLILS